MNIRRFAMSRAGTAAVRAIGVAAVAAAAITGVGATASAAPAPAPILHLSSLGPMMLSVGQNAFCNGIIDTRIDTDPERPGTATVVFVSRGMHGVGPEWAGDPHCRVRADITHSVGLFGDVVQTVDLNFGEQPGETFQTDIFLPSGLAFVTVQATYVNPYWNEFRPQWSTGTPAYFLVP